VTPHVAAPACASATTETKHCQRWRLELTLATSTVICELFVAHNAGSLSIFYEFGNLSAGGFTSWGPKYMRHIFLLSTLFLGACATVQVVERNDLTEQVGQVPALGTQADAPVGGVLFSQFRYWSKVGYRLDDQVNLSFALGRVSAQQGDFLIKAISDGKPVFCTEKRSYIDPLVGPHAIACFPDSGDGLFRSVSATPGMVTMSKDLPSPIHYSKSEEVSPRPNSFKYELLFQGISGRNVRISYREFVNDLARPAYFQDVSYDVTEFPTILTFRTVKIEIIAANNNGLKYRVLTGF
jgi:hypothetical protein